MFSIEISSVPIDGKVRHISTILIIPTYAVPLDGVGPRELRPRRPELAWLTEESNQFGTGMTKYFIWGVVFLIGLRRRVYRILPGTWYRTLHLS